MTTYNKSTLQTFFEQGDVPSGTDYANLIDSQVNIVETSVQAMGGALSVPELITPRVSATTVNITGNVSANAIYSVTTINAAGNINAGSNVVVSADVSALGTVYASAMRPSAGVFFGVGIVSAAGTTQGTATILTNVINRGQGVADGATTGFAIPANKTGLVQYLLVETNTSANLWPPTGGTINGKAANTVFALAGQTSYTIFHVGASAYGVK